tara:strand:+ start:390 stop:623 length:234 start_codon:yes stop_codon:yes gene_type:complete
MVGVKKLKETRLNPCRSVVNNFSIVKIEGWAVLRDTLPAAGRELDGSNLCTGQVAIGIKRAGALLIRLNYGTGEANR